METLQLSSGPEQFLRGGRKVFPLLSAAFEGVNEIAVVGWGSQAPAQAQNGRDSLLEAGSKAMVRVALRDDSEKFQVARLAGFRQEEGTLGTFAEIIPTADMVVLLINDNAQTERWQEITGMMKPGATLCVSHGFLFGYLDSIQASLRDDINVILVAPKGMGPSLRRLYNQSRDTEGAGINSSVAVVKDLTGCALDYALGWSIAIGSPVTFFTTGENEWKSDLTGERHVLLAGIWALSEALYEYFRSLGRSKEEAFLLSARGLTSTVTELISKNGLEGLYESLTPSERQIFEVGYNKAYLPARQLALDIYESVSSGDEIRDVIQANRNLAAALPSIETSGMWKLGGELYRADVPMSDDLALAAGMYAGMVLALMDVLRSKGHAITEIVNESLIEAVDSLTPFMNARGVAYMVDNCSVTARLGTRKWGPPIKLAFLASLADKSSDSSGFGSFRESLFHGDIKKLFALRPSTKIAVE